MKHHAGILGFALSASIFAGASTIALLAEGTDVQTVIADTIPEETIETVVEAPANEEPVVTVTTSADINSRLGFGVVDQVNNIQVSDQAEEIIPVNGMTIADVNPETKETRILDLNGRTLQFLEKTPLNILTDTEIKNGTLDLSQANGIAIKNGATLWLVDVQVLAATDSGTAITLYEGSSLYMMSGHPETSTSSITANNAIRLEGADSKAQLQDTTISAGNTAITITNSATKAKAILFDSKIQDAKIGIISNGEKATIHLDGTEINTTEHSINFSGDGTKLAVTGSKMTGAQNGITGSGESLDVAVEKTAVESGSSNIYVGGENGNWSIAESTLSGGNNGITVSAGTTDIAVSKTDIDSRESSISVTGSKNDVAVTDGTFTGSKVAITLQGEETKMELEGTDITSSSKNINILENGTTLTANEVIMQGAVVGINVAKTGINVTLTGTSIDSTNTNLWVSGDSNSATLENTNLTGASYGVYAQGKEGDIQLSESNVDSTYSNVYVQGSETSITTTDTNMTSLRYGIYANADNLEINVAGTDINSASYGIATTDNTSGISVTLSEGTSVKSENNVALLIKGKADTDKATTLNMAEGSSATGTTGIFAQNTNVNLHKAEVASTVDNTGGYTGCSIYVAPTNSTGETTTVNVSGASLTGQVTNNNTATEVTIADTQLEAKLDKDKTITLYWDQDGKAFQKKMTLEDKTDVSDIVKTEIQEGYELAAPAKVEMDKDGNWAIRFSTKKTDGSVPDHVRG